MICRKRRMFNMCDRSDRTSRYTKMRRRMPLRYHYGVCGRSRRLAMHELPPAIRRYRVESNLHSINNTSSSFIIFIRHMLFYSLEREREMFYLTTHSTHFIYGYMPSDIWLRTILIVRKETCCHIGYSYRLTARVLLYAPSHSQDNTYHSLCYTSRGALAGTRNSSMGPPHEGSIR